MKTSTLESNDLIAPELTHMDLHGVCDGLQRAVARTSTVNCCNASGGTVQFDREVTINVRIQ